ncbi:MAG: hypothetical protein V4606_03375 [Patescibacteria group bacterium]
MLLSKYFTETEEDIHVKILRYALDNPNFTHADLIQNLKLNYEQQVFIGTEVSTNGPFFTYVGGSGDGRGMRFMLSFEGRSRLLEYDELKEARQNSKQAFVISIFALVISIVSIFAN